MNEILIEKWFLKQQKVCYATSEPHLVFQATNVGADQTCNVIRIQFLRSAEYITNGVTGVQQ